MSVSSTLVSRKRREAFLRKFFSIEEANRLVPMIRIELTALQRIKREIDVKLRVLQQMRMDEHEDGSESDPFFRLECEIEFAQLEARTHMNNIINTGAELKDVDLGLVDFPAWKDGVEVLLCWRLGEEKISYWHGRDSGFMGRMPIEE